MAVESSAEISYDKLLRLSHANIYNMINTAANVDDPVGTATTRKWVYVRQPRLNSRNFAGYPYIIVNMPRINIGDRTLDSNSAMIEWEIIIEVWSADRYSTTTYGDTAGDPKGAEYLQSISDSVISTLTNATNQTTMRSYGMYNIDLSAETNDYTNENGEMIFNRDFRITFNRRMGLN